MTKVFSWSMTICAESNMACIEQCHRLLEARFVLGSTVSYRPAREHCLWRRRDDQHDRGVTTLIGDAMGIVAFTSAGISAENGTPTFRDPLTDIWARHAPARLKTPTAFREDAALAWSWYLWRRQMLRHTVTVNSDPASRGLGKTFQQPRESGLFRR